MIEQDDFQLKAAAKEKVKERAYWTSILSDVQLDGRIPNTVSQASPAALNRSLHSSFPTAVNHSLKQLCGDSDLRMFIVLTTAAFGLLQRYSGKTELMVTVPTMEQTVNQSAINHMLPLKAEIDVHMSFSAGLDAVKQSFQEAVHHQNFPVHILMDELWHSIGDGKQRVNLACAFETLHGHADREQLNADVLIVWKKEQNHLHAEVHWDSSVYEDQMMEQFSNHFMILVEQFLKAPEQAISTHSFLSEKEKSQLFDAFQGESLAYPVDRDIVSLFQQQVQLHPARTAVVFGTTSYTYEEVDRLSDRIALRLSQSQMTRESPVGLRMYRSAELVIAILGILKAGYAYLPIDVHLPIERIRYMLNNSGAKAIVSDSAGDDGLDVEVHVIQDMLHESEGKEKLMSSILPSDMAYVLYTSGTTGHPKGVVIEHRHVINLVYGMKTRFFDRLSDDLQVGMLASHIFDASVQTLFPTLLLGHTLHIAKDEVRMDGHALWDFYQDNHIQLSDVTPSHLKLMNKAAGQSKQDLPALDMLLVGGEVFTKELMDQFLQHLSSKRPIMINAYGPTECTVQSSSFLIPHDWDEQVIPIGQPMPNERIFICDTQGEPVPIGVFGELYISGDGVGRGYINHPDLNKETFIKKPELSSAVLYRTGDLARWRFDGLLEFAKRNDNQVKIRGYRIELEEVRKAVLDDPNHQGLIQDVIVIPKETTEQDQYICAYLMAKQVIDQRALRQSLSERLPGYMVPRHLIQVDQFPLNLSGKLDIQALPNPEDQWPGEQETVTIQAHNETEQKLVRIFASILQVPASQIRLDEPFFDLGGNSFNIVELSNKVKEEFQQELTVMELFQYTTVLQIADQLRNKAAGQDKPIEDAGENEADDLESAAQLLGGMIDE
ncbi:non-ribosomal peptide synthetase [Bacillus pumilus]|uniref:Non-ribosomal peptide synthetase n=1 Tax=Bacillus pumilus TaxID=1408 RepID=A0A2A5IZY3_BACPU|nr:non-ribosomal peptide synthetase [Bacillus pumilus]PCK22813.1 non-ribosomal peptide synthetase [Bacillus pumilus]